MEFFGREVEINELVRIRQLSRTHARFTVVTGRRRVGKTELLEHALNDGKMRYLYLLITNRAERELCGILQDEVQRVLEAPILGRAERFSQLFEAILLSAQKEPLTLVVDEFQEFDFRWSAIFAPSSWRKVATRRSAAGGTGRARARSTWSARMSSRGRLTFSKSNATRSAMTASRWQRRSRPFSARTPKSGI